eukprot:TRINITY_DN7241_c0_g1_i1.p1 TRINITY_DN7241_c0_g1~~TRINITY_DN7241_c0_g1_i1.p1  ORF type:complete len:799 (-),score=155.53 TRINITY_DN7241_c0_g1_i1:88-2484(-)
MQRTNPKTNEAVVAVCKTSFSRQVVDDGLRFVLPVPGRIRRFIALYSLVVSLHGTTVKDGEFLHGLPSELVEILDTETECDILVGGDGNWLDKPSSFHQMNQGLEKFFSHKIEDSDGWYREELSFHNFPPGSVLLYEMTLPEKSEHVIKSLSALDNDQMIYSCFQKITSVDFQYLLFSSNPEERTHSGRGTYHVDGIGDFPYAGIAGVVPYLQNIRSTYDLGHPLCNNLRQGNWLMDYTIDRIPNTANFAKLKEWLTRYFKLVKQLPRHLIPKYFDKVLMKYYLSATHFVLNNFMSTFVKQSKDGFLHQLAMTSLQMVGCVPNAELIDSSLAKYNKKSLVSSMAAGLPHFASGFMRSWGRDTMISLRGLLLVTGRFAEAEELLVGFAMSVRHGLVPNLLDGGRNPRYNSRDSTWWFLQAIKDYCSMAPNGLELLTRKVPKLFPWDLYHHHNNLILEFFTVADIIKHILESHVKGIHFREREAGKKLDDKMQDEGFNVKVYFDRFTGFIIGGNQKNCGTWMDKMGESKLAGNFGVPATPRDGANIEIIGLVKSVVGWLAKLSKSHPQYFPHTHLLVAGIKESLVPMSLSQWDTLILTFFESRFYIPKDPKEDSNYTINPTLVNRRGIYKDSFKSTTEWADYQLRPNQCIAMAVAPEMFNPQHARDALEIIEKELVGPLGMKTLDPSDYRYRPNYNNWEETNDFFTSKGFNYHQGPEWIWPLGYFLRAKIHFFKNVEEKVKLRNKIHFHLHCHREHMDQSPWQGLPELTNHDGQKCDDSCPTQAWSSATLLDALYDLQFL